MTIWKKVGTSAALSMLFMVVYGFTNWHAAQRADVGMIYFEWERQIPFVSWMIIPYMSIDLFFVAAPFLCTSEAELKVFARRITFAILVGGAFFLLFPLRFAFDRPGAEGWLGVVIDWFRKMDQPVNLLPSLHITLRTILAATFARHAKGAWRVLAHIWFSLIGISTVLTYQHHLVDLAGGFILAAYAFYFFTEASTGWAVIPNRRVGSYYLAAMTILCAVSFWIGAWGIILLWPALSVAIVVGAYFGLGPSIYRKEAGGIPLSARIVLGPVLFGQFLSLRYYQRQCRAYDKILPQVWIGRRLTNSEAEDAVRAGVTAVLDLTAEFSEVKAFRRVTYLNIPVLDLTAPTTAQLEEMADFIEREAKRGVVYVHCKIGYSRSAGAVTAFLLKAGHAANNEEAQAMLRSARPSIVIRPEIVLALKELETRALDGK